MLSTHFLGAIPWLGNSPACQCTDEPGGTEVKPSLQQKAAFFFSDCRGAGLGRVDVAIAAATGGRGPGGCNGRRRSLGQSDLFEIFKSNAYYAFIVLRHLVHLLFDPAAAESRTPAGYWAVRLRMEFREFLAVSLAAEQNCRSPFRSFAALPDAGDPRKHSVCRRD